MSIPAVREGLLTIAPCLAAVGLTAADDVTPLRCAESAVAAITVMDQLGEVSEEQVAIIALVGYLGTATRRQIEEMRGDDSETLLRRLVARDLLKKVADERAPGGPNVYRLTTRALAALGIRTLESLQGYLGQVVGAGRCGLIPTESRLTRACAVTVEIAALHTSAAGRHRGRARRPGHRGPPAARAPRPQPGRPQRAHRHLADGHQQD
jgi:Segregation and condensation complex subunit ScpB